ncbi:hypothetical protein CPARA_2gp327 (nucleomorph) [Cryptomonas paramecium]|uniref:Uncharacterized protein n=1 Tax=Cryptomonas paramaecium TaxID=2898 RepID=F2HI39_9CRYP|nr:hypothetical protein CPARA_2gp327 [Cryptomonas paramecium]AEA38985.1 hypothetical protein CPARA_2gp327 [Cryptomonas paramecium]
METIRPGKNIKKLTKFLLLQGKVKISKKALVFLTKFCIQTIQLIIKKTKIPCENTRRDARKKKLTQLLTYQTILDKYTEEIKEEKRKIQIEKKRMKNIIFCKKTLSI